MYYLGQDLRVHSLAHLWTAFFQLLLLCPLTWTLPLENTFRSRGRSPVRGGKDSGVRAEEQERARGRSSREPARGATGSSYGGYRKGRGGGGVTPKAARASSSPVFKGSLLARASSSPGPSNSDELPTSPGQPGFRCLPRQAYWLKVLATKHELTHESCPPPPHEHGTCSLMHSPHGVRVHILKLEARYLCNFCVEINTYGNEEGDRIWDFHLKKMIENNQTCVAGQNSVPYMTCLVHVLEEWLGVEQLEDYLNFANHLLWVFTPLILLILPYFTIFLLYLTIIFLHIYKRKNMLKEAYSHNLWDGARKTVATLWDGHAAVWHGYEVHGMEKIPEGPALIIFYHGAIPIDFYYFMAKIFIHKGRTCRVVADHFVFKIPGFSLLLDVFCALHGPREKCVEILRSGHLLAISPGGVREALLSDETYSIIWGNRKGFAQVAIDAKVPIIPMFTQNIREGFRSLGGTRLFKWLYEKFRYPFAPMYGGFPVKLRTFLGDPIPYDPKITAEELAEKTKNAVQALIDKHQRIPGNIRSALLERFHREQKAN